MNKRQGFTLVELLVVITIIGMLMGLLLPAVNAARENGRRAVCLNNITQLGKAVLNFESINRRYPAYAVQVPNRSSSAAAGSMVWMGWPIAITPQIERGDLYDKYINGNFPSPPPLLEVFVCPSNPPDDVTLGPRAYVANCGRVDNGGAPYDLPGNGVFFRHPGDANQSAATMQTRVYMSNDYIDGQGDGTSNTLMLTENNQATGYADTNEGGVGFVWVNKDSYTGTAVINADKQNATKGDLPHARPSSNHTGGVNATFCDGHSRFIQESIAWQVLQQLMTSNGKKSDESPQNTYVYNEQDLN